MNEETESTPTTPDPRMVINFREKQMYAVVDQYPTQGTSIFLQEEDGSPGLKATIWIGLTPTLALDYMFIKNWSENKGIVETLVRSGVVRDTGKRYRVGSVEAHMCQLTEKACLIFGIERSEAAAEHSQGPQREVGEYGYVPPIDPGVPVADAGLDNPPPGLAEAFAAGNDAVEADGADGSFEEGGKAAELNAGPEESELAPVTDGHELTEADMSMDIEAEQVEEVAREVQEGMDATVQGDRTDAAITTLPDADGQPNPPSEKEAESAEQLNPPSAEQLNPISAEKLG